MPSFLLWMLACFKLPHSTFRHPKIEPHRLQMNLKYQIWTCVKLLRWNKTPIWPWESRAHSPANRFWPWVHRKLDMKLILNWESFDVNVIWNLNWIWNDCELNLKWIWIWNDCEFEKIVNWIESELKLNLIWVWGESERKRLWVWAPSHHVHILTTECSLTSLQVEQITATKKTERIDNYSWATAFRNLGRTCNK